MEATVIQQCWDDDALRLAWDQIVHGHSGTILEMDVTSTFEWSKMLRETQLGSRELSVVLLQENGMIRGILPLYSSRRQVHHIPCRGLSPISEFHSGRCGFILDEYSSERLELMFQVLFRNVRPWDVFIFTLVDGSESDVILRELLGRRRYHCERISSGVSPYIVLEGTWDQYLGSLPSKFRWQLRNREKRMGERGEWRYREFTDEKGLDYFYSAMLEIERESWKHKAGTSVASNEYQDVVYRELGSAAARKGWFSGNLLELNGEPIGYIYGLIYNSVFCGLKETYKDRYKELSPGHMIQMLTIKQLFAKKVRLYDFMGECEEHKLVWTANTYSRSTYVVYNSSLMGVGAWIASKVISYVKTFRKKDQADTQRHPAGGDKAGEAILRMDSVAPTGIKSEK